MLKRPLMALALCLSFVATTHAGVVTYDFNGGSFGNLVKETFPASNLSFTSAVTGGTANLSEAAGGGNGYINYATPFNVAGDFTATVSAIRSASIGVSELVFSVGDLTNNKLALADIFFNQSTAIGSNIFLPTLTGTSVNNSTQTVAFKIERIGTTITTYYDAGSGFQSLFSKSNAGLAAAAPINIQLLEEFGDTGSHAGSYDNLTITSNSVPEPTTLAMLCGAGAIALHWRPRKRV